MASASTVPSGSRTRKTSQGRYEGASQPAPSSPTSSSRPLASASGSTSATAAAAASSMTFSSTRRHSLFGTDDRIIIDLGSRVVRAGFSGESRPRLIRSVAGLRLWEDNFWRECKDDTQMNERLSALLGALTVLLREVFYQHLMVDPRQRKVIVAENPLMPSVIRKTICKVLFGNLQVSSVSFVPSPLLALTATGRITGLVLDIGHHETRLTPIYFARPLTTLPSSLASLTTSRAGVSVAKRLRSLLLQYGRYVSPTPVTASRKERTGKIKREMLDDDFLEEIIVKTCFVGRPIPAAQEARTQDSDRTPRQSAAPSGTASAPTLLPPPPMAYDEATDEAFLATIEARYASSSKTTPLILPLPSLPSANPHATLLHPTTLPAPGGASTLQAQAGSRGIIVVPGWVRERAAEVLFEEGDEDEASLVQLVAQSLIKLPIDLRLEMAQNILLTGGTAMLPGLTHRFRVELVATLEKFASSTPDQPTGSSIALTVPRVGSLSTNKGVRGIAARDDYSPIAQLARHVSVLNDHSPQSDIISFSSSGEASNNGTAPAFGANLLSWLGASLLGSLKLAATDEMLREAWDELELAEREREAKLRGARGDEPASARPVFGVGRGSFVGVVGGLHTGAWGALSAHQSLAGRRGAGAAAR